MANLKGGSFEKQVKDIHHRLAAFGEGRYGKTDHQTHSSALSDKRAEISKSFAEYCSEQGLSGKLNEHMTNENIERFLDNRLEGLAQSTQLNYVGAVSSMVEGLKEKNVSIPMDKKVLADKVAQIKELPTPEIETERAINNVDIVIDKLYEKDYSFGVVAEIQKELGFRVSEAVRLVNDPSRYITADNKIENMIGKGNHLYNPKPISLELQSKINAVENKVVVGTYQKSVKEQGEKSHNFRYTYVKENIENMTRAEMSRELNHTRESMTDRYIVRL